MGTMRTTWRVASAALAMTLVIGTSCTKGSDDGSASTTTSSTTIPDEQKPPLLRDSWTPEDLDQLAEIEVPHYENGTIDLTDSVLDRVFVSDADPDGSTLTVEVHLAPCDPVACWDLAQGPDDEQLTTLRSLLRPVHRDDPNLVFEYGTDELIGDFEVFTLYWRSFVPDDDAYATGYHARYHDDLNLIEITLRPSNPVVPDDDEALEAQMPEEWAREVTTDVFVAFADEFNADR